MKLTAPWNWSKLSHRTPVFQQAQVTECGIACLGTMLAHFGCWVSMNELRHACGVNRDGNNAADLKLHAERYGLDLTGWRKTLDGLKTMRLPVILHWKNSHFLVLERIRGNRFYLNDPAKGRWVVDEATMKEHYSHVALELTPNKDFHRVGKSPSVLMQLIPWMGEQGLKLLAGILLGVLLVIPLVGLPMLLGTFIDQKLTTGNTGSFVLVVLGALGVATSIFFLTWIQQSIFLSAITRVSISQAADFVTRLLYLPVRFFTQRLTGELTARTSLPDRIAEAGVTQLTRIPIEITMGLLFLAWLAYFDLLITLALMSIAILNAVLVRVVSHLRQYASHRWLHHLGLLVGTSAVGLRRLDGIQATGRAESFLAQFSGLQADELKFRQRVEEHTGATNHLPIFFVSLAGATVLGIGALRVLSGELSVGDTVAIYFVTSAFLVPIGRLSETIGSLQVLRSDLDRIEDVTSAEQVYSDQEPGDNVSSLATVEGKVRLAGKLELQNVSFGYNPNEQPVLERINFTINPGQLIALVGRSGAGKSTLASLVAGLQQPWNGTILFDGRPRAEIPRDVLVDSIAYVSQHVHLFTGTIRENLTMWNSTIPDALVVNAARDALIHDEIARRPLHYESPVYEEGSNFSGGQRQRLELALGLVNKPSLLILDEATSDLDVSVEREILDNLRKRGCSCLIIAHRLSTVRDCDEILVLEEGSIVQRGTHDELIRDESGLYQRLATSN